MGLRDPVDEIIDALSGPLELIRTKEGRDTPELLAMGLQIVVGLGSGARDMIDWMGRKATSEERHAIFQRMGHQALLSYGDLLVARAVAHVSAEDVEAFLAEAELAILGGARLPSELTQMNEFGEAREAF